VVPVKTDVLVTLPFFFLIYALLIVIFELNGNFVVGLSQTRHFFRSVKKLLYFFWDFIRKAFEVDEGVVWIVNKKIVGQVYVTFWSKNIFVEPDKHLNLFKLFL